MKRRGQRIVFHGCNNGVKNYTRYTHLPSGKTCFREPHFSHMMWLKEKMKFFVTYSPSLRVVCHDTGKHLCDVESIVYNTRKMLKN